MKRIRVERSFPIRGIREDLPPGERVLWQGAPAWRDLAFTAFHLRQVAIYFGTLLAIRLGYLIAEGASLFAALRGAVPLMLASLVGLGLLAGIALWSARTTIYAVTTRRVVMRVGMALPLDINLPFSGIESASLALRKDGHGDLPLALQGNVRLAYAHIWPYARPWKLNRPEPMFRAVPDAANVAQLLAEALAANAGVALPTGGAQRTRAPAASGLSGFGVAAATPQ